MCADFQLVSFLSSGYKASSIHLQSPLPLATKHELRPGPPVPSPHLYLPVPVLQCAPQTPGAAGCIAVPQRTLT
ncbi:hypothetical protein DPEC_G00212090 [Dallia pectoralis]|uniref:Uncharacterized protein n=1 Tax=Dallia pectoralis TaxID=75939 RepID=A0ACC2G691_DALPE|nr:hypothetical protein DPEC_G00212090 [Dallia pectoralis]